MRINMKPNYMSKLISSVVLAWLMAACAATQTPEQQAPAALSEADAPATPRPATPTTSPAQEFTLTPPIAVKAPVLPQGPDGEWQLVVIGDSSLWGLGEALVQQIETDMGVKVTLYDVSLGGLSAGRVLKALEDGKDPDLKLKKLSSWLAEAEMVVMWTNPEDSSDPQYPFEIDGCFASKPPGEYSTQGLDRFSDDLAAIWARIFELRQDQPVILRGLDFYNPLVAPWQEEGVFEVCTECWEILSAAARRGSEMQGVPFLSRLDAFNGPAHDEDPRAKGLIDADGQHPTEAAGRFTAQLLSEMGYEATFPAQAAP
jgi:hypothetical protein